jgi:hypothetical protein
LVPNRLLNRWLCLAMMMTWPPPITQLSGDKRHRGAAVSGTLVSKTRSLQPYSGMTGYNGIIARLQQAMSDPGVDGILLDMDTPGGMVSGRLTVPTLLPVCAISNLSGRWLMT